jgi:hypothetical protein
MSAFTGKRERKKKKLNFFSFLGRVLFPHRMSLIGVVQQPPPLFQVGLLQTRIQQTTRRSSATAHSDAVLWFECRDDGTQRALPPAAARAVESLFVRQRWHASVDVDATHTVTLFAADDVRIFLRDSKDDILGRIVLRHRSDAPLASPCPTHFPPLKVTTDHDHADHDADATHHDDHDADDADDADDAAVDPFSSSSTALAPHKLFLWRFDDAELAEGAPLSPNDSLPFSAAHCHLVLLIRDRAASTATATAADVLPALAALPPLSLERLSNSARSAVSPRGLAHAFGSTPRDALSTRLFGQSSAAAAAAATVDTPGSCDVPVELSGASARSRLSVSPHSHLAFELFVWNGQTASAFVRAACLSKGFELERALEADKNAAFLLFNGRWQGADAAPMCALVNDTAASGAPGGTSSSSSSSSSISTHSSLLYHLLSRTADQRGRQRLRRQNLIDRAPPRRVATESDGGGGGGALSRTVSNNVPGAPRGPRPTAAASAARAGSGMSKAQTVSAKRPLVSAVSELPLMKPRLNNDGDGSKREDSSESSTATASTAAAAAATTTGAAVDVKSRKVGLEAPSGSDANGRPTAAPLRDAKGRPTAAPANALKLKSMSFKPGLLPKIDLTLVREVDKAPVLSGAEQVRFFDPICSKINEFIYLGSRTPAMSRDVLKQNGITHVLNCAGTICDNYFPNDFHYTTLALIDGGSEDITCLVYHVLDLFEDVQRQNGKVFVHCHAGISRSSSFVIAYVMWKKRRSYEAALKQVKDIRATVSPNFGFNMQLHTWWTRINSVPAPSRLYRIVSHSQDPDFLVHKHVPVMSAASLDPRSCFVLYTPERVWAWHGERAMARYRDACSRVHRQLVKYENAPSPLIGVQQGSEPAAFWTALGGKGAVSESTAYNQDYSAAVLYSKKPASLLNRAFVDDESSKSDSERALLFLYPNNFLIDTVTAADFERVFVSEPEELEENCLYILVSARRDNLFAWLGKEFSPPGGAPAAQFAMDALKCFKKQQQHYFSVPPRTSIVQGGAALNEQFVDTILTV